MPIRKYSPELLNLAEWPKVDVSVLSEEDRVRYLRLEGAIKAACNDEKSSSVTASRLLKYSPASEPVQRL